MKRILPALSLACFIGSVVVACAMLAATFAGCTTAQLASGIATAEKIDDSLLAKAQQQVDALPPGKQHDDAAKKLAARRSNDDLYRLIGETVAPLLVPTTQPSQNPAAN